MEKTELPIAAPCTADWRKMTPADGGRFCGDCKKVVRDLSSMRERDAKTLLRSAGNGELCVRYLYDKHGKIFFAGDRADQPPLMPASFLQRAKRVAFAAAAIAVPLSLQACSASSSHAQPLPSDDELHQNMGGAPPADLDNHHIDPVVDGGATGDASPDVAPLDGDAGADATADAETPIF